MRNSTVALILLAGFFLWHYSDDWPAPTPGVLAPAQPVQVDIASDQATPWTVGNFKITPLATYSITARIMHREPYWFDEQAGLSPVDFALGWGKMSDPTVYQKLHVDQAGRWYTWYCLGQSPIDANQVTVSSANTHLLPGRPAITAALSNLRAGDVVHLSGYLVRVDRPDGWHWVSSTTRTDTGDGSCEVMWVNEAAKVAR